MEKIYCDNTDCKGKQDNVTKVKLKDEFEGGECYWCEDCRARDWDMIDNQ